MNAAALIRDYPRAARRVRWLHRADARRRVLTLRELSKAFDANACESRTRDELPGSSTAKAPPARIFASQVADMLDGRTLLYSDRLKLLKAARRQGLSRFDANLIIAAVQNRMCGGVVNSRRPHPDPLPPCLPAGRQYREREPKTCGHTRGSRLPGIARMLAAVAVLQSLIVAAAWWILSA